MGIFPVWSIHNWNVCTDSIPTPALPGSGSWVWSQPIVLRHPVFEISGKVSDNFLFSKFIDFFVLVSFCVYGMFLWKFVDFFCAVGKKTLSKYFFYWKIDIFAPSQALMIDCCWGLRKLIILILTLKVYCYEKVFQIFSVVAFCSYCSFFLYRFFQVDK